VATTFVAEHLSDLAHDRARVARAEKRRPGEVRDLLAVLGTAMRLEKCFALRPCHPSDGPD